MNPSQLIYVSEQDSLILQGWKTCNVFCKKTWYKAKKNPGIDKDKIYLSIFRSFVMKDTPRRITIGYIKILWYQQSLQGSNCFISLKYRLPIIDKKAIVHAITWPFLSNFQTSIVSIFIFSEILLILFLECCQFFCLVLSHFCI